MYRNDELVAYYKKALQFQRERGNFDLTARALMPVWNMASTSAVVYRVKRLEAMGLFKSLRVGTRKYVYRAVER